MTPWHFSVPQMGKKVQSGSTEQPFTGMGYVSSSRHRANQAVSMKPPVRRMDEVQGAGN